jgi:hypothetical protein
MSTLDRKRNCNAIYKTMYYLVYWGFFYHAVIQLNLYLKAQVDILFIVYSKWSIITDFENMHEKNYKNFVELLFTVKILPFPLQRPMCAMLKEGKR